LIAALAFAVLLIFYQPLVGVLVIAFSLISVASLRILTRKRMVIQQQVMQRQNDLAGKSLGAFVDVETIKASGREQETFAGLASDYGKFSAARDRLSSSSALLVAVPVIIAALSTASVLIVGGYFVLSGALTIGALFAMLALATNINAPLTAFMAAGDRISVIGTNLQALDDVLEEPVDELFEEARAAGAVDADDVAGDLELRSITFGYSRQEPPLLDDFSLKLGPGQRVALVGGSGSGKSTIANIATGLLHPWSGDVLLDEHPLLSYRSGIREQAIAKVDQTVVLFAGTIRQNVTLFDDSITDDSVIRALEDAQILDDVLARDGGLDAVVEENGRNFSGGQRQRMEIARALVREPRVVILDEATSALDEITEARVDAALRRRGVTCLIVAHRLSTVRDADRIVVLGPGGELLEAGTHEELISLGGNYEALIGEGEGASDGD
ncbi:MAG TPA: ATP-binding cassette domain-containing protein, partial [Candidatus Nanopelagicales bacterium]|nr:ATP-binding cassette domain-containing protein [Candidatus Nanopelagicales bacterium]